MFDNKYLSETVFDFELFVRKPGELDGWLLLSGLATLLQQLHPQVLCLCLQYFTHRFILLIPKSPWHGSSKVGKIVVEKLTHARDSFTLASDHQEVLTINQVIYIYVVHTCMMQ